MVTTAYDITAFVIDEQLAAGRTIDKLQLQKLLYLVQGAHLELWGSPAFREEILAYRKGPVVRTVEQTYRAASEGATQITTPIGGDRDRVTPELADTIRLVLGYFGDWSGPSLESFVKRSGSPWCQARGDLPTSADSSAEIKRVAIRAWFGKHGVNPSPRRLTKRDRVLFDHAATGDPEAVAKLL